MAMAMAMSIQRKHLDSKLKKAPHHHDLHTMPKQRELDSTKAEKIVMAISGRDP